MPIHATLDETGKVPAGQLPDAVGGLGTQGPPGEQGPVGDKGPIGDQGPVGNQGIPGGQGSPGIQGDKGLTGDKGTAGDKGTTGDKGATGDQGSTGNQGPTGLPASTILRVSGDKSTGANTTPVTLGVSFPYAINSTYVVDIYALVAPTAATTGCSFLLDTDSAVTYVGTGGTHQLAASGTASNFSSIGDRGATAIGVSSGMVGTGNNFVFGAMLLITTTNTGTATLYFQSETTAVTTAKSGSTFVVTKVA